MRALKKYGLWIAFVAFFLLAVMFHWATIFSVSSEHGIIGKSIVWAVFIGFAAYSYYCGTQENFYKSIKTIAALHWGRQVGIDLYLGLGIALGLIYAHEQSVWIMLVWALPTVLFGNLATLLYLAIHYDSLVSRFLS